MDTGAAPAPPAAFPFSTTAPQWGGGVTFSAPPVDTAATAYTRRAAVAYVAGGGAPRLCAPLYVKRPCG